MLLILTSRPTYVHSRQIAASRQHGGRLSLVASARACLPHPRRRPYNWFYPDNHCFRTE